MADVSEAIRAKLDATNNIDLRYEDDKGYDALAAMGSALTAVLDRHRPGYPDGPEYEERDEPMFDRAGIPQGHVRVQGEQIPGYYCETCREVSPCETVKDVAAALGIEVPGV